jgi:hypothetical protein
MMDVDVDVDVDVEKVCLPKRSRDLVSGHV